MKKDAPFLFISFSLVLAMGLIFLTACAKPVVDKRVEGKVIKKEFKAEQVWTNYAHVRLKEGSDITIPQKTRYIDDADYIVIIRKQMEENDAIIENKIFTTREIYDTLELGDWFIADPNTCEFKDTIAKIAL